MVDDNLSVEQSVTGWLSGDPEVAGRLSLQYYCQTRDVFQARLSKLTNVLVDNSGVSDDVAYLIAAIVGEIGNNSFDHNVGSWPDVPGVFFGYDILSDSRRIVLADRGQGVYGTLKKVKPDLENDMGALKVAFTERVSGRAPEKRGNGLKFVKQGVSDQKLHLRFVSGSAEASLNDELEIGKASELVSGCLAVLVF